MLYYNTIKLVENICNKKDFFLLKFNVGDTINVYIKIKEINKERIQQFEGIVIRKKKSEGNSEMFTVRKISNNIGVEKIFSTSSPNIVKVELKKKGFVRRARLYYLRGKYGKSAKVKHKK